MSKYELKDLQLHKETINDNAEVYYLSAIYEYEDDCAVHEVVIPRIILPINDPIIKRSHTRYTYSSSDNTIDIGFGDLTMAWDESLGYIYYDKIIEEKVYDMTLEEIEKKLGYKVRVVSEKVE